MLGFFLVFSYFALALIAALVLLQPDRFTVRRTAVIDASPDVVFRHINELRNWENWSPWAKLDPQAQGSYSGPSAGAGATFEWSGNKQVGAGRMTIVASRPNESVDIRLEMKKPFAASNGVSFTLEPEGGAAPSDDGSWLARAFGLAKAPKQAQRTKVTWTMSGRNSLVSKAMNLVVNCDKTVGGQFEKGLVNLNATVAG